MNPNVTYIYLHNRVPALTYRFTVDQFYRLADLGILVWGDRTELIDGQVLTEGVERRFTVEEFDLMAGAGVLQEDDRVELLNGELVLMAPIGYRHAQTVSLLTKFFARHAGDRYEVNIQNPIEVFGNIKPQPDVVLYKSDVIGKARHPASCGHLFTH